MSIIKIDMAKAKEVHKTNIRNARADKLAALDVDFQRALETSSDTSLIVANKQALRDAPAAAIWSTIVNKSLVFLANLEIFTTVHSSPFLNDFNIASSCGRLSLDLPEIFSAQMRFSGTPALVRASRPSSNDWVSEDTLW